MDDANRGLRMTFDAAADLYQHARPDYPELLFDQLITTARPGAGARLLEIGCATGKATSPLARRGFRMTCVEPGPALAAAARRNLGAFPDVEVVESTFESIDPSRYAEGYLRLLDTFSGHIAMQPWQRQRLYGEIRRRLDERPDGRLRRGWGAVLHVARRRDLPPTT